VVHHDLHVVGISFRSASEEVLEGLAFSTSQTASLLAHATAALPGVELLVLSTCNRTELYVGGGPDAVEQVHRVLRAERPAAPRLDDGCSRYHLSGADAFRHLLRVTCGLDSALLGDGQVAGQVRQALTLAQQAGTLGALVSPAVATALRTSRKARAETQIGRGAPGVGGAVAQALLTRAVDAGSRVLVLGSGQAARAVTRSLVKEGFHRLEVVARDAGATRDVAAQCGASPRSWADLGLAVADADVVVAATAAPSPVLRDVPGGRLVIDAGFPRQVEPTSCAAELVSLLSLTQEADAAAEARAAAVPEVEGLVADEVARWVLTRERQPLERAIKQLHQEAARATREAAEQLSRAAGLDVADIERVLGRQVRRVLHDHVSLLRSWPPA
jgi:glutamyl-tRNA reductase